MTARSRSLLRRVELVKLHKMIRQLQSRRHLVRLEADDLPHLLRSVLGLTGGRDTDWPGCCRNSIESGIFRHRIVYQRNSTIGVTRA